MELKPELNRAAKLILIDEIYQELIDGIVEHNERDAPWVLHRLILLAVKHQCAVRSPDYARAHLLKMAGEITDRGLQDYA